MNIAVIGSGNIGQTIGGAWHGAGHEISFARSSTPPEELAATLDQAEAVLLAIPGAAVAPWLAEHGGALAGKLVFDATNRVGDDVLHNAGAFAQDAPDARLVRAFNTLGWEAMSQQTGAAMFWCGPEDPAVTQLITDVGLRPVRVGDLDTIDVVDGAGRLWLTLVFRAGMPRTLALELIGV
jgi:predicted dinucleotide-binding enzyme